MRMAMISKNAPENWKVSFYNGEEFMDTSHGYPTFEAAAEAVKIWILQGIKLAPMQ